MNHRRITIAVVSGLVLEIINKISPLLILHHAQQSLGLSDFGWAQYQIAFFEVIQPLIVFGFPNFALAESGTKGEREVKSLFTHLLMLKIANALIVTIVFLGFKLWRYGYTPDWFAAGILLVTVLASISDSYWFVILRHKLAALSLINAFLRVACLGLIFALIQSPVDRGLFVVLSLIPNFLVAIGSGFYAYRELGLAAWQRAKLIPILRGALPFAFIVLLTTLLDRLDLFLVDSWFGLTAAGVYAGPSKIVQSLSFLISALALPFYAEILKVQDPKSLWQHTALSVWLLSALVAPIVFGVPFIEGDLIALIFPGSVQAGNRLLSLLSVSMIGNILLAVYGLQILMSKARPWPVVGGAILGLVTLVTFAGLAKASLGLQALAIGMACAKLVMGVFCAQRARKELPSWPWRPLLTPMLAGAIMALGLHQLKLGGLVAPIVTGAGLYALSLLIFNYRELRDIVRHPKFPRFRRNE